MARTRTWFPDLPEAFVARYYADQAGKGLLGSARGSILDVGAPLTAEEQRQAAFGVYWAWWSSPEYQERLDERREAGQV